MVFKNLGGLFAVLHCDDSFKQESESPPHDQRGDKPRAPTAQTSLRMVPAQSAVEIVPLASPVLAPGMADAASAAVLAALPVLSWLPPLGGRSGAGVATGASPMTAPFAGTGIVTPGAVRATIGRSATAASVAASHRCRRGESEREQHAGLGEYQKGEFRHDCLRFLRTRSISARSASISSSVHVSCLRSAVAVSTGDPRKNTLTSFCRAFRCALAGDVVGM